MDIKQLRYFTAIVDNSYNLSHAAEILYISQPTLSMMINDFEKKEQVKLFKREKGRIIGLTYVGEKYYEDAKEIIEKYNQMFLNLHDNLKGIKGTITIGIPPLVLSVVFSTVMPKLILENPDIKFNIKELGAYSLKNDLLLGNVDIAVLLSPTGVADNLIETYEIQKSELSAFVSPNHRLAKKNKLKWSDFEQEKLAIFDNTFMIHHLLNTSFERHQVHPNVILTSGSWDFMLNATKITHDIATILPKSTIDLYQVSGVKCLPIEQPIIWRVCIARLKKENYTKVESYILETLTNSFKRS